MDLESIFTGMKKDQDSRGDLKLSNQGQTDQDSLGVLKKPDPPNFNTPREDIEDLPISEIEHFTEIPDYIKTTRSKCPIVVKSPTSCHCIDGWELIEKALVQGESRIICTIFYIPEYSKTELSIQKTAIRTMAIGGKCSYPELIRNAYHLYKAMIGSSENPVIFSHGGARRGENYTNNKEDSVIKVLANRLEKSESTVKQYINFAEYLSNEAMGILIESKAKKAFFEEAASNKKIFTKNMRGASESDETITAAVSDKMLLWLEEFKENNGTIKPVVYENVQSEDADESPEKLSCKLNLPQNFEHRTPNEESESIDEPTEEDIRMEFRKIGVDMVKLANNKSKTPPDLAVEARQQILVITKLIQWISFLDKQEHTTTEKEEK